MEIEIKVSPLLNRSVVQKPRVYLSKVIIINLSLESLISGEGWYFRYTFTK